ncbi:hypothetical protein [Paenibacillus borealis]|uniref:Uncharacterized protein n=1 Tax=Paenibacillus borealis TaxID=160799 RepID=A0A089LA18_PAEBO|nr:hypothetical protein [Paenibacillus borealis]AIQ55988.1 hypothetical protein PBOR_02680 [Paenibacillus borealis]
MNHSRVVTGRIIEINDNRVLTQQGETLCTYHPRYYMLPEAETWTPAECDLNEAPVIQLGGIGRASVPTRRWKARLHWFSPQKKSANRI